jgi:abhydrolase domain-containing protein 12
VGLITDGVALVDWAMHVAGIPPSRIVLLGQSLGTAVASAVAEQYVQQGVEFAGIVLVAGFSELPTMLSEYRMGGYVPVLAPFHAWPALLRLFHYLIVDKWHTSARVANIVRLTKGRLRLSLLHAKNDPDIPWTEDNKLFKAAVMDKVGIRDDTTFEAWKKERTIEKGDNAFVTTWSTEPNIHVRQELFPYGGTLARTIV